MITGRSPGHHGIYDFIRVENQTLDHIPFRLANARDIRCEPLWSITPSAAYRAAVSSAATSSSRCSSASSESSDVIAMPASTSARSRPSFAVTASTRESVTTRFRRRL